MRDVILALPATVSPLKNVRATILISSVANLRQLGLFEPYAAALPREFHAPLFQSVAGHWLPVEVAHAHYVACDAVVPSAERAAQMGRGTAERIGTTLVGTAVTMAKQAGATPWDFFPHLQRFWGRGYDGGAISVARTGPKDAHLELHGFSLCESQFFRNACRGWVASLSGLFCTKMYVTERAPPAGAHSLAYRAQWV